MAAPDGGDLAIRFWGVRGTLPVPGPSTLRFGGNTSCVEVRCAGQVIMLDAGTGLHHAGEVITSPHLDILLSHTHIDHIIGLPFFTPAYDAKRSIGLWAGHLQPEHSLLGVIGQLMSPPLLPLTPASFLASMAYHDFTAGQELQSERWRAAGITVTTLPLSHPDRATGYRISYAGKSVCYITDYEHVAGVLDSALVAFVAQADGLIYDSTYSDETFERHKGWGHSTWQQAVRLADAACIKKLFLFHHDPYAGDDVLSQRAEIITKVRPDTFIATEGQDLFL